MFIILHYSFFYVNYGSFLLRKFIDLKNSKANISADAYPYNVWATSIKSAVFDDGFDNFNFDVTDLEILTGEMAGQYCTEKIFGSKPSWLIE